MFQAISCNKIILSLSDEVEIHIIPCCEVEEFPCVEEIEIYLINKGGDSLLIYSDVCVKGIQSFINLLKCSIDGCLNLHDSIQNDIGLQWNDYCQKMENKNLFFVQKTPFSYWIGHSYLLWLLPSDSEKQLATWLYTKNGSIYLEITPQYHWHFVDGSNEQSYESYLSFRENYKTIAKYKISIDIAKNCLLIIEDFLIRSHSHFSDYGKRFE